MAWANARPYALALEALDLGERDAVLEIGFGPGAGLRALTAATPNGRVCGVDHSATMVAAAARRSRSALEAGRLELRHGPFSPLPWRDATFDKALLVNVVYFFDRAGGDAREVYRTLRPGGVAVVYATERETMAKWPFAGEATHRTFDRAALVRLLVEAGFAPAQIEIAPVSLPLGIKGLLATARKPGIATPSPRE